MPARHFFLIVLCLAFLVGCTTVTPTNQVVLIKPTDTPVKPIFSPALALSPTYLKIYPVQYQEIQLPQLMVDKLDAGTAKMVALPTDPQVEAVSIQQASVRIKNLNAYNFNAVATFSKENAYSAVPEIAKDKYDFVNGEMVGLFYDKSGAYGTPGVYQILMNDKGADMLNSDGKVVMTWTLDRDMYYKVQDPPVKEPLVVFIENGCWLCWSIDGRSGCLICR